MLHGMWGQICIPGIAYVFCIKELLIRCMRQLQQWNQNQNSQEIFNYFCAKQASSVRWILDSQIA